MKTFLRFGVTAIALIFFFNAFGAGVARAQDPTNEILKRLQEHRAALKTLRADVTMDKHNSQLGEHDTKDGSVIYMPGQSEREMYIRIDWTRPSVEQLAVIKGEYTLFTPRLKQAIVGKVDGAKNSAGASGALAFMSMSKEQLKANYTVKYMGEETVGGAAKTWHLLLTPKAAGKYKSAEIWIDGNGMPLQAKVVESNNDSTTVLLKNLRKNETINAKIFKIDLPKGTKEIKG
jgi:outer membrane lipoprotein-sorting protein